MTWVQIGVCLASTDITKDRFAISLDQQCCYCMGNPFMYAPFPYRKNMRICVSGEAKWSWKSIFNSSSYGFRKSILAVILGLEPWPRLESSPDQTGVRCWSSSWPRPNCVYQRRGNFRQQKDVISLFISFLASTFHSANRLLLWYPGGSQDLDPDLRFFKHRKPFRNNTYNECIYRFDDYM